jgi:hypothetical protein
MMGRMEDQSVAKQVPVAAAWAGAAAIQFYLLTRQTVPVHRGLLLAGLVICATAAIGSLFHRGNAWALLATTVVASIAVFGYLAIPVLLLLYIIGAIVTSSGKT